MALVLAGLVVAAILEAAPAQSAEDPVLPDVTVAWPAASVRVDTTQVVRGRLTTPLPGAVAALQRQVLDRWIDIATVPMATDSDLVLTVPTAYYGHFLYRVRIATEEDGAVETPTRQITVLPEYSPRGRDESYALISSSPVGRWDPCTPIRYRVNLAKAPQGAMRDVRAALANIARASGLEFTYAGPTTVVPFAQPTYDPAVADLVIAWAWPSALGGAMPTGTFGLGGEETRSGRDVAGNPVRRIWQGGVTLSARYNRIIRPGAGKGLTRVGALMHELGHAVGLFHVEGDPSQIMTPWLGAGLDVWGAGDLAGLEAVGAVNGCVSDG
ncbi:hypothetical protein [Nocardioides sp.]|uniref:hypothetical protein n=1 Tax=Nocardioides sp. TaxID=35761 RepID=UPI0025FE2414|nr:hypothetical protein [Nocardioides sp.]